MVKKIFSAVLCLAAFVFIIGFAAGCSSDNFSDSSGVEIIAPAFYSESYDLPQSQNAAALSNLMTSQHPGYHQFGWDFEASLEDGSNETTAFFMTIERTGAKCTAMVGFRNKAFGDTYVWSLIQNTYMETTGGTIRITNPLAADDHVTIQLLSGLMGSPNATYRLYASVADMSGKRINADLLLRDPFGAINQGYGTTSFYPNYITSAQRTVFTSLPEKTFEKYFEANKDPMTWQGDYYYALPMINVERYTIEYDGKAMTGASGKSWVDFFIKSFNAESALSTNHASWSWFAIQLPDISAAINLLDFTSDSGKLPTARLFNNNGTRSKNGARIATHSWEIDKITVEPVAGSEWVSPLTKKSYTLEYRIHLNSSTFPGELQVKMAETQEIGLGTQWDYQGLGKVTGTIGGTNVGNGRCWIEVEELSLPAVNKMR